MLDINVFRGDHDNTIVELKAHGTTKTLAVELLALINSLYNEIDVTMKEQFKKAIQINVSDDDSPVWGPVPIKEVRDENH